MGKKLLSIDLETLDTAATAVILEIGIVVGTDDGTILEKFRIFPEVSDQLKNGRTISADTILWWMKQDGVIINEQGNAKRMSHEQSVVELVNFITPHLDALILGNAPSFDCDILASFIGYKPWQFYMERDVRTARIKVSASERAPNNAAHSALADAEAQYRDFVTFLAK